MRRSTLVYALLMFLVGCNSSENLSDAESVSQAQAFIDRGNLYAASIILKNAMRLNPDNKQTRWMLGRLYLESGNGAAAEKELSRARELGVVDDSVVPLLARALLSQKKYADILDLGREAALGARARADLSVSRALALLAQKKRDDARVALDEAEQAGPDVAYVWYGKARLSMVERDFASARQALERALGIDGKYAPAWSLLGDLNRYEKRQEEALAAYDKAVEYSVYDMGERLKRVLLRIQMAQYDQAQAEVDDMLKLSSGHAGPYYAQGLLHFLQNRPADAQQAFEKALQVRKDYAPAIYYLGWIHLQQGNLAQADEYLTRFLASNRGYIPGRKALAVLKLQKGDYETAELLVRPVTRINKDDVLSLNILAEALLKQGKTEESIRLYRRVVELQPDSVPAKMRLGFGLLTHGDEEGGVENLDAAIELNPQLQKPHILLVLYYLERKELDQALTVARSFVEQQPDNVFAYNLLGQVFLARQEEGEARKAFHHALQIAPGDPEASLRMAALARKEGKMTEARADIQSVLDGHKDHLAALVAMADLEAGQGNRDAEKKLLERAVAAHPEVPGPKFRLARFYLQTGQPDQVFVALRELRESQGDNPQVLALVGAAQLASKEYEFARSSLRRLAELTPNDPAVHRLLSRVYDGLGDRKMVREELLKAVELAPEHVPTRILAARVLLANGEIDGAREQVKVLEESAGEHPDVRQIAGAIAAESGDTEMALAIYEQLFHDYPAPQTLFSLHKAKWMSGNRESAVALLENWVQKHPEQLEVRHLLADAYIGLNREADARIQYEEILKRAEDDAMALNNLAWQLRETDPERALKLAKKANEIDPDSPSVMDTLATVLLAQGDHERVERILARGLALHPENPSLRYRRARLLEATGKVEEAVRVLKALLHDNTGFPEREHAKRLLRRLERS